jgi:hypothetical protein
MSTEKSSESGVEISFSAKGFGNLPKNVYENDFTFIVGDNRYYCPSFVASFLSPRICHLQMKDPTLREFYIETKDPTTLFSKLLEVCYGSSFRVCESKSFFGSILTELWNRELSEEIFGKFDSDLTILNVVDRLKFSFSMNESCEREIEFCSSHFYEIDLKSIFSMPFEIISNIISNESLQLKDEDSFFEIISSNQNEDSRFFSLFEYVRFEYLSTKCMKSFIEIMNESFDFLTFPIWRSLCHRLSFSVSAESSIDRFVDKRCCVCQFEPNSNQNGIISYLTKRFEGHVIDRDIVSITASSINDPQSYPLRHVADFENQSNFQTKNEVNSWICYDFKDMQIKVTHYSIRTRRDGNSYHLRSWTLEGSKDGLKWVTIDDRQNDTSLNSQGAISVFSISESFEEEFRMTRIRQTGKNSSGSDNLS